MSPSLGLARTYRRDWSSAPTGTQRTRSRYAETRPRCSAPETTPSVTDHSRLTDHPGGDKDASTTVGDRFRGPRPGPRHIERPVIPGEGCRPRTSTSLTRWGRSHPDPSGRFSGRGRLKNPGEHDPDGRGVRQSAPWPRIGAPGRARDRASPGTAPGAVGGRPGGPARVRHGAHHRRGRTLGPGAGPRGGPPLTPPAGAGGPRRGAAEPTWPTTSREPPPWWWPIPPPRPRCATPWPATGPT